MAKVTFHHTDAWTTVRDGETGLEVAIFDDGVIIVERFLPDEPEKNAFVYVHPSLEDWKRIRDMAEENVRRMEQ